MFAQVDSLSPPVAKHGENMESVRGRMGHVAADSSKSGGCRGWRRKPGLPLLPWRSAKIPLPFSIINEEAAAYLELPSRLSLFNVVGPVQRRIFGGKSGKKSMGYTNSAAGHSTCVRHFIGLRSARAGNNLCKINPKVPNKNLPPHLT